MADLGSPATVHHGGGASASQRYVHAVAGDGAADVVLSIDGVVIAMQPGREARPVLGCIGASVRRAEEFDGGWRITSRDVLLYTDLATGRVTERGAHLATGVELDVVHDWLDPVTIELPGACTFADRSSPDETIIHATTSSTVRHPLRPDVFARENSDVMLQVADHTVLTVTGPAGNRRVSLSMVRFIPWLPWMLMGGNDGSLVLHLSARPVESIEGVDQQVSARIKSERPEFAFAPNMARPVSENSWTQYLAERQPFTN
jgi:hypothetical protein